ncbi:TetR/AcrR family transcriptional regulator [Nocardia huaxiensis]|uniref:TetR/AcrR family transcriptional regulator C-terminal domain-containing protein n=1 Tax=Nocardia huaxiensis TaxID=2755382 RepID=A0A7D6VF42_9NOCA|nr:TetR/AcrR family transcriptional regulator C-terminal domain-containing protein [Nocardia huaxiensis]QLY33553.1 TetR/AcrR family transcriptional regulator C-terminal domain-containing protein [Nocardia huaxiensis]UFS99530.1 TetR/AcrR family transcriptional regulator C-terminal domain-containing protein [Nocardia huaxiensis]
MPRPKVPLLSRERIRGAALTLIDRDGLPELSMRKLAAELGVQAASLYGHYPTKDDLLDDIARGIMSRVDTSGFESGDWCEGLVDWARSYRAALVRHPNFVPYLASGPGNRDENLRAADAVHGGLISAGWPPREATMIGAATRYLVMGSTLGSFSRGFPEDTQVYRDRYPHLDQAHRLRAKADEIDTDSFELALAAFIDGLRPRFEAVTERRAKRRRIDTP